MEFLKQQKIKLQKRKKELENELGTFAKKDPKIKGNWKAKFPFFGSKTADPSEEQDQVEEYATNLELEHTLELELAKVNKALEKIKRGKYGICEKCGKKIIEKRLQVYPEAEMCMNCTT